MLLQNTTAILLQNATEIYHKMCQFFYYKIRRFYYRMRQLLNMRCLLQIATVHKQQKKQMQKIIGIIKGLSLTLLIKSSLTIHKSIVRSSLGYADMTNVLIDLSKGKLNWFIIKQLL